MDVGDRKVPELCLVPHLLLAALAALLLGAQAGEVGAQHAAHKDAGRMNARHLLNVPLRGEVRSEAR